MDFASAPVVPKEWKNVMKHNKAPILTLSVVRPSFPGSGKVKKIDRYFNHMAEQWIQRWQTKVFQDACRSCSDTGEPTDFKPWDAAFRFTLTYWRDPILSLYIDICETGHGDRPFLLRLGETWDCSTGYPRSLRSFFPAKNRFWRKNLLKSLKEQAIQQINSGESLLDHQCPIIMERAFDPDNFYLTEEGISVFYPLYILGPYAEGIPVFTVPFSQPLSQTDVRPHP